MSGIIIVNGHRQADRIWDAKVNDQDSNALPGISSEDSLMLLRASAELSFNSLLITDTEHCILYANPAFCNMTGYALDELVGMTGYALDELVGQNPRILQGELTEPAVLEQLRRSLKERGFFSVSTVNYRKDGRPYMVEWTISTIKDSTGDPRFFLSIQKDVTQLQAEQATGNLFAKAIDAAYDGIFITTADGTIELANQGFEIITGYTTSEEVGRSRSFLKSGHHDNSFYARL
jgi:PAS domain S-box-containing protein